MLGAHTREVKHFYGHQICKIAEYEEIDCNYYNILLKFIIIV